MTLYFPAISCPSRKKPGIKTHAIKHHRADRIKNLMESTLDEIDILENKKSQFAQQLDDLTQKLQSHQ